ncbi:unnamed protein product [Urochloa decumbens]|uniref:Zinc finger PHD-type domain-containing protein n=1 Tax=Urochloa decumbens TaxID=240449 RepID=A0ABC9BEQ1_9POAL
MFHDDDDDDDAVEPQFKVVDDYYFEDDGGEAVCFSILPFQFDENDEILGFGSRKNVYLRGLTERRDKIYKRVVAWRVEFGCEQPDILLLSEGKWIKLLKPWKVYAEKISRSTLITLQMLHFVRKYIPHTRNFYGYIFDHLNEVFSKFDLKPAVNDLRKQCSLIKLFVEKDHVLMRSKILQRFLEDAYMEIEEPNLETTSTEVQFIVDDESHATNCDHGHDDDEVYNNRGDDDGDGDDDDYSHHQDDNDEVASSDGHSDNDDGADPICAMCDDGGKLLSCKGQCKRAFHPTKKHGRRSECETLGYTSAQQKRIATYICKNCKYMQHQCFKCGELEPSDEPNAKVFQCNTPSCGYFYHPKCVAQLLQPGSIDGALEKKISARMPFSCPIHWCFKCKRMEDRTQEALQFVTCRRCPKYYHRQCLPREISFKTKDQGATTCAWELPEIKFFYCPDHVDKATKTVRRDHIKFPPVPKICRTRDPGKKRIKMTGKRKHSMRSTELSDRLCRKEIDNNQTVTMTSLSGQFVLEPERAASEKIVLSTECAAKRSKEDVQSEPCMRAVEGQKKQSSTSCSFRIRRVQTSTSYVVDGDMEKRETSAAEKETNSETSCDVSRKGTVPLTRSTLNHSIQTCLKDANGQKKNDKAQEFMEKSGMHSDLCAEKNTSYVNQRQDLMEKDAEWDKENYRMSGSVNTSVKEQGKPKKDTSCGNGERKDMFDSLDVERDTEEDGSNLQSGKVDGMEWEESACRDDPLSQQDGAINLEVYSTICHANHKEHATETELNSPRCRDDNKAAVTSEDRSKERTMSNKREELVHDMRGNSFKSPLRRNTHEMPTYPSPERRMMNYRDSYPINSYKYRYQQRCHVNCCCVDYFTCRKHSPLLDEFGNLMYGGYHAMSIDPFFQCSLQDNSTAFQPCTDIRMGGDVAVYGTCSGEYEMRSDDLFGWVPWAPAAMSVPVNYAAHSEAHLAWRQTYNQPRGWPMLSHTNV